MVNNLLGCQSTPFRDVQASDNPPIRQPRGGLIKDQQHPPQSIMERLEKL